MVQATERVDRACQELLNLACLSDVGVHEQGITTTLVDQRDRLLTSSVIDVRDHHCGTTANKCQRGRSPDTRAAARHERHLAAVVPNHPPPSPSLETHAHQSDPRPDPNRRHAPRVEADQPHGASPSRRSPSSVSTTSARVQRELNASSRGSRLAGRETRDRSASRRLTDRRIVVYRTDRAFKRGPTQLHEAALPICRVHTAKPERPRHRGRSAELPVGLRRSWLAIGRSAQLTTASPRPSAVERPSAARTWQAAQEPPAHTTAARDGHPEERTVPRVAPARPDFGQGGRCQQRSGHPGP